MNYEVSVVFYITKVSPCREVLLLDGTSLIGKVRYDKIYTFEHILFDCIYQF